MVFVVYKMLKNLQLNPGRSTTILRYFEALPPNNANHFALLLLITTQTARNMSILCKSR